MADGSIQVGEGLVRCGGEVMGWAVLQGQSP